MRDGGGATDIAVDMGVLHTASVEIAEVARSLPPTLEVGVPRDASYGCAAVTEVLAQVGAEQLIRAEIAAAGIDAAAQRPAAAIAALNALDSSMVSAR